MNTHGHKNWILSQRVVSSLISYQGEIRVYVLLLDIKEGVYEEGTLTSVTAHLYNSRVKTVIYSDIVGLSHLTTRVRRTLQNVFFEHVQSLHSSTLPFVSKNSLNQIVLFFFTGWFAFTFTSKLSHNRKNRKTSQKSASKDWTRPTATPIWPSTLGIPMDKNCYQLSIRMLIDKPRVLVIIQLLIRLSVNNSSIYNHPKLINCY